MSTTAKKSSGAPKGNKNAKGNKGGGRPSLYKPEYAEEARKLCAVMHATDLMLAEWFGVSERTINEWKMRHVEFFAALRAGKDVTDDLVERSTVQHIIGYHVLTEKVLQKGGPKHGGKITIREWVKGDPNAGLKWLAARRPEIYREQKNAAIKGDEAFLKALEAMNERAILSRIERDHGIKP
jgi:hypothetical protein